MASIILLPTTYGIYFFAVSIPIICIKNIMTNVDGTQL